MVSTNFLRLASRVAIRCRRRCEPAVVPAGSDARKRGASSNGSSPRERRQGGAVHQENFFKETVFPIVASTGFSGQHAFRCAFLVDGHRETVISRSFAVCVLAAPPRSFRQLTLCIFNVRDVVCWARTPSRNCGFMSTRSRFSFLSSWCRFTSRGPSPTDLSLLQSRR